LKKGGSSITQAPEKLPPFGGQEGQEKQKKKGEGIPLQKEEEMIEL